MALLTILHEPNPLLRERSQELSAPDFGTPTLHKLIEDLIETMLKTDGVGIAAPQVGIQKRIIIVNMPTGPQAFINPVITEPSFKKVESEEGCLSVPGIYGLVKRSRTIALTAADATGKITTTRVEGLPAIIFQHEVDHLDGVLFIDRVTRFTQINRL